VEGNEDELDPLEVVVPLALPVSRPADTASGHSINRDGIRCTQRREERIVE
jgi:hypothetical protein